MPCQALDHMMKFLRKQVVSNDWIPAEPRLQKQSGLGVLYRKSRGHYIMLPSDFDPELVACVSRLNVTAAFTMKPELLDSIVETLGRGQTELKFMDGSQLQVSESFASMTHSKVKKFQYASLVRREAVLLVWHDDVQQLVPTAAKLDRKLIASIWGTGSLPLGVVSSSTASPSFSSSSNGGAGEEKMLGGLTNESNEALDKDEAADAVESL